MILNRSTVFVRSLVRNVLEERVHEESASKVELDSVEPSFVDGFVGSNGVPSDIGLELFDCQRTRGGMRRGQGDGGWADQFEIWVFGFE